VEPVSVANEVRTLVSRNRDLLFDAAFVVHNGNGYRFVFRDPSLEAATDPTDNTVFTGMLASVTFN
jgi:hypothetical protein